MRFTLCKLFLGVTMAALASAGMTLHTRLWAESIVSFSFLLHIAVAILAFRRGGDVRAFRIAFAAVGGGYLLLVMCNTFTPIRDLLITNRVLVLTGQAMEIPTAPPPSTNPFAPAFTTNTLLNGTQTVSPIAASTAFTLGIVSLDWDEVLGFGAQLPDSRSPAGAFLIIGHCVWSWLLALLAGCFAAFACRPRAAAVA